MLRIAINGFGRIGRMVLRSIIEYKRKDLKVIAVNDCGNFNTLLHLFKYDSVHGKLLSDITISNNYLSFGSGSIKIFSESRCEKLPWEKLNIDLVIDCSGQLKDKNKLIKHINAGAKKVIVSTIIDDADLTVIYGINHNLIEKDHKILSNASCTSNCLIPIIYALHDNIGIKSGHMTSIHAYTNGQSLVDSTHRDFRRARAVNNSIIPSTTNASKAIELVFPKLKNKIYCSAIRVPIPNVSMIEFNFISQSKTTLESINNILLKYSKDDLKNIIECTNIPLVSIDFTHNANSSIIDLTQTHVTENHLCTVASWYDNEWGYANRICDVANYIYHNKLL